MIFSHTLSLAGCSEVSDVSALSNVHDLNLSESDTESLSTLEYMIE